MYQRLETKFCGNPEGGYSGFAVVYYSVFACNQLARADNRVGVRAWPVAEDRAG